MHYSRALARAGRKEESAAVLERFRQLGPEEVRRRPNAGLFEYLSMSAAEQRARYMTNLTRMITTNPRDPGLKLRLGKAFL